MVVVEDFFCLNAEVTYFVVDIIMSVVVAVGMMSLQTWCFLYDYKKDDEEGVSVSVNMLSLDMKSYDSLFLEML